MSEDGASRVPCDVEAPTTITFALEPSEDKQLTCILCGYRDCDREFVLPGEGRRTWHGVHLQCVERMQTRRGRG